MRTPGTYISGAAHVGLIAWLIAGWGLSAEPMPFDVSEVSVVSGEEFAQLVAARTPQPATALPDAPIVPVIDEAPKAPDAIDEAVAQEEPALVEPPDQEVLPDIPEPNPVPTEVEDTPPDVTAPALEETPAIPEPITDNPPQARPAPRVAPDPVIAPEPEITVDAPPAPPVADQPSDAPPDVEPIEPAAAQDASTQIVTEPETPSGAMETSLRPMARPNRPAPQPAETQRADEPETTSGADVNAALADALANEQPAVPQGPPMTGSEQDAFRIAVNRCWNVDPGSVAARVEITVGFSLTPEGRVDGNVVRQIAASGGDPAAVRTAFEAARRAILRCQTQSGYDLPAEKYGQWKDVEITFDPSGMRLR